MRSILIYLAVRDCLPRLRGIVRPAAPCTSRWPRRSSLAIQNNPQLHRRRSYNAAAAYQVPPQYKAAYEPNLFGSFTGVGADNGSRLAAGGLNNPIVYNRVGSGLSVSQMITDFGRTSNLIAMAKLRAAGAGPGHRNHARARFCWPPAAPISACCARRPC